MARDSAYQPVNADDEEKTYNLNETTDIIPTHTRSFVLYLSVLFVSLSANVLLLLRNGSLQSCSPDLGKTIHSTYSQELTEKNLTSQVAILSILPYHSILSQNIGTLRSTKL